jgi:HK97 family phage prohead protease
VKDRRVISGGVELRSVEGRGLLVGRPVVYDSWSEPIGGMFRERILPGAFDEWLAGEPDVIACVNHDPARLLGRTASGTVRLVNDKQGLSVEVDPPATTYAADLAESVKRGDIRGMSFVFECTEDRWGSGEGGPTRDVLRARIYEVSYVTFPAYPETSAALRSLQEHLSSQAARGAQMRAARLRIAEVD